MHRIHTRKSPETVANDFAFLARQERPVLHIQKGELTPVQRAQIQIRDTKKANRYQLIRQCALSVLGPRIRRRNKHPDSEILLLKAVKNESTSVFCR